MCCVLESWHLEKDDNASGEFPASYTDTFLNNLKCFFVEALVFPRVHMGRRFSLNIIRNFLHSGIRFKMNLTTVPPFITPSQR